MAGSNFSIDDLRIGPDPKSPKALAIFSLVV